MIQSELALQIAKVFWLKNETNSGYRLILDLKKAETEPKIVPKTESVSIEDEIHEIIQNVKQETKEVPKGRKMDSVLPPKNVELKNVEKEIQWQVLPTISV